MTATALFIVHKTKPGRRDAVRDVWMRHMASAVDQNPGHLSYAFSFDDSDPDGICAFQIYASASDAERFLSHPSYLAYLQAVELLLEGPPHVRSLTPQWWKGSL